MLKKVRWCSMNRIWNNCALFGIGIGWERDEEGRLGACFLAQMGRWLLVIGPHWPLETRP